MYVLCLSFSDPLLVNIIYKFSNTSACSNIRARLVQSNNGLKSFVFNNPPHGWPPTIQPFHFQISPPHTNTALPILLPASWATYLCHGRDKSPPSGARRPSLTHVDHSSYRTFEITTRAAYHVTFTTLFCARILHRSGRQLEESPSSRRKKMKSKRAGSYRCMHPGCYATSSSAKAFKRHEQLHQAPDPKAKCGRCGRQLSRVVSLARHERKCQRRGPQELVESSQESGEQEG